MPLRWFNSCKDIQCKNWDWKIKPEVQCWVTICEDKDFLYMQKSLEIEVTYIIDKN